MKGEKTSRRYKLSHVQIIALGFFIMIAAGTLLLMLPFSSKSGEFTPFTTSLFTATSASCVTGLVLADTATHWSLFGQIVIITLIQIGGLGFMTIAVLFTMLFHRRAGLREREIMVESINQLQIGGILDITKMIFFGTLIFEGAGAVLLSLRFIPLFGWGRGIYYSVFHSISAFCNAGFDLMGTFSGEYSSLTAFYNDPLVSVTIMALITVGGIGFFVWDDLRKNKFRFKKYKLHSKLVLTVSLILTVGGALLFFIFEKGLPVGTRILNAFFDSVTARTAGFNTVDIAAYTGASKLLTVILMFIGGSSGSTAGGIKTTTVAVILIYTLAGARGKNSAEVFGRSLEENALKKAVYVFFVNLLLALGAACFICAAHGFSVIDVLLETFSAMGTVGMSTGITRELGTASKYIIILLMYLGRVGSISVAGALFEKRTKPAVTSPAEKILVG
ncbi:MAG: Trk family potassium uptake protein [Ruminococcaceae bacterium]|nr:Trk family potassium uptake protein [Oscillospiraceae bacterium]